MNSKALSELEYDIINECVYDSEPLSMVLFAAFSEEGYSIEEIAVTISNLVGLGYLQGYTGSSGSDPVKITQADLMKYIGLRKKAGENMAEWPEACEEILFKTTKKGVAQLRQEHKPIYKREDD